MQKFGKPFVFLGILIFVGSLLASARWAPRPSRGYPEVTKQVLANALKPGIDRNYFPERAELDLGSRRLVGQLRYTIDLALQNQMEKQMGAFKPDYGAFVAIDPQTGAILSMVSYSREGKAEGNLALQASFPAASVFKIVTAAAAIDQKKAEPDTLISFNGSNHTLYKRNVLREEHNRWTRKMTLREAFAKSVNTVFAKLGIGSVREELNAYAERFNFNRPIPADVPVQEGKFAYPREDEFAVGEVASGYNRAVVMSPLQGALMAGAIANDGAMMEPFMVESFREEKGAPIYTAESKRLVQVMSPETAKSLREMMQETVQRGTSQKSFRQLSKKAKGSEVEMGGKTGSLTGTQPKGKYDWFVGYARYENRALALCALTINEENWRVKSSYLARMAIEHYFSSALKQKPVRALAEE